MRNPECLTAWHPQEPPRVSRASFTSRETWWKTLPNVFISPAHLISYKYEQDYKSCRVHTCVLRVLSACVFVCVYVAFQCSVSLKAPLCSLLHISPITTPISVLCFHFFFSLHLSVTAPLLPALSTTSPSLYSLFFYFSHARSPLLTLAVIVGSGDNSGFFLCCCYLVAVIMKAGARNGGMKGWRDGVLFCDGCQWVH